MPATPRCLIVNADDYNSDRGRCDGILEAARRGIVSSTTVLANLPWQADNVDRLQAVFGRGVGVHLNLTKGRPLTVGRTLVDGDGNFLTKPGAWRRALLRGYDLAEVETEFVAQVARLRELGIVPSHLDGNNHIHVFPGIDRVAAKVAARFAIGRIRLPRQRSWQKSPRLDPKRRFLGLLCRRAAGAFRRAGLVFPDHFAGIAFPRPGRVADVLDLMRSLPPGGVTELMCHPGYRHDDGGAFSTDERQAELTALTDPLLQEAIRQHHLRLISFADLPCRPR